MNPVEKSLLNAFNRHRIVVWYDEAKEWADDVQRIALEGVEKVVVENTEFGTKHRVLHLERAQKFLLYIPSTKPDDSENWLLDVLLANHEFRGDKISLLSQEAGLPRDFSELATQHQAFFAKSERREALKSRLQPDDDERTVRRRMMAVLLSTEDEALESILLELCKRLSTSELVDPVSEMLAPAGLESAFWGELERTFHYRNDSPSLLDFVIEVFRKNAPLDQPSSLNNQAVVFLGRWKDSGRYKTAFRSLSARVEAELNISHHLNQLSTVERLVGADAYERIEMRLVHHIRSAVIEQSLTADAVASLVKSRERSVWFDDYADLYHSLRHSARLIELINAFDLRVDSFDEGLRKYAQTWWKADYHYRKFHFHRMKANQQSMLDAVEQKIEGLYVNRFLLTLANHWQEKVDSTQTWASAEIPSQTTFFEKVIRPFVDSGQKVFVVVSDALRYECAAELQRRIEREDRFKAELKSHLGALPSFTQLGMAALLPHSSLSFSDDGKLIVADGQSTTGTEARDKILRGVQGVRACAMQAEEFLALNTKTEGRALSRDHDVVFIFHNEIDNTGDKLPSEGRVFSAVESALEALVSVVKKIANTNVSHMIVTADHGFLFQNSEVDDADCLPPLAYSPLVSNRRYVVAESEPAHSGLRVFRAGDLGLEGNQFIGIVKSLGRLPVKGSGKRYVHGGASLQEVVLPLLQVRKARESDVEKVEVEVQSLPARITTGQVALRLYQTQPVAPKVLERSLRMGVYSKDGKLVSESVSLRFDSTQEEPRQRETNVVLLLSHEAERFNNQEVIFRIDEPVEGTSQFRLYSERTLRLSRAFESDFDGF